jgi:hypothetical protein
MVAFFGDKLFEINDKLFHNRYPQQDKELANICLHIMVGQLPNVRKLRYTIYGSQLDLRIHCTVLSPSGTNKGAVFTYVDGVCKALNSRGVKMKFKIMGKFTDSALVGTPNTKKVKEELTEDGEPVYGGDGKIKKITKTVPDNTYGALYPHPEEPEKENNILAWSEGSQVLDVNLINYNQDSLNILQQCMNPMDSSDNIVSKGTGLGEIAYNTNCSIFMVTYKPHTLNGKVTGTGFLQRQIVLNRTPTMSDSRDIGKNACAGLTKEAKEKVSIDDLVDSLVAINNFGDFLLFSGLQFFI